MTNTAFQGNPVKLAGDLPALGSVAPDFTLTGHDLADIKLSDYQGKTVVLNIFPSLDTDVCANSVRAFNASASQLDNTVVLCISQDLPFAMGRFCTTEGLADVVVGSAFRSDFATKYGLALAESILAGLLARCVIVVDPAGTVKYVELVPEITQEPDYEAALAAI